MNTRRSGGEGADSFPEFVAPMLAKSARPFDSDRHSFEVKWDGFRGIAVAGRGTRALHSRRRQDLRQRFPDLTFLDALPDGTILDGEIVVLRDGRPDFSALVSSERDPFREPATYVAFDLLYDNFRAQLDLPLRERRVRCEELVRSISDPQLVFSEGVVGKGKLYFEQACERGLEGVVAKDLDSPYTPGKRSDAWQKIKRPLAVYCLILGYLTDGRRDLKSLLVATEKDGELRYVGRVGSGLDTKTREGLLKRMRAIRRETPLVPCDEPAEWIEPTLYCMVRTLEFLPSGMLRAPVFEGLVEE